MTAVRYAHHAGAATLTLGRPERRNPVDPELVEQLQDGVRRAALDEARVVVLRAEGPAFSVGGDVTAMAAADDPARFVDDLAEGLHRAVSDLQRLDAVVVAAVHAVAAGAGFGLAAAADLVLAGESASFTLAYTRVGLTPDGGTSLLTASLGLHRALHLALLNPRLTAREAQAVGLVAQVHPDEELDAAVDAVVAELLAGSRTAQVGAKRLLRELATPYPEGAMRRESLSVRRAAASPDGREGLAAFTAKRPPRFPSAGS